MRWIFYNYFNNKYEMFLAYMFYNINVKVLKLNILSYLLIYDQCNSVLSGLMKFRFYNDSPARLGKRWETKHWTGFCAMVIEIFENRAGQGIRRNTPLWARTCFWEEEIRISWDSGWECMLECQPWESYPTYFFSLAEVQWKSWW